jgi:serine/threonine protein kinase
MQKNKLNLIAGGCNSQLFSYGMGEEQVVLKVVSTRYKKELSHLRNEYQILHSLSHRHIVKVLKYR